MYRCYYKSSLLKKKYKSHNVIEMQRKCQKMCGIVVFFHINSFLIFHEIHFLCYIYIRRYNDYESEGLLV
ncbi:hypothetical protein CDB3_28630 [Bacillus sp. CDB3]|nr:hypothetical protein CDB3_28630 [Bacillus sp. CDB3]